MPAVATSLLEATNEGPEVEGLEVDALQPAAFLRVSEPERPSMLGPVANRPDRPEVDSLHKAALLGVQELADRHSAERGSKEGGMDVLDEAQSLLDHTAAATAP